ncbi:hypothetical protein BGX23_008759 [Mortierella sp. AD031]|nr:hypothetical protein BGX23_008759 [Mortierella sp. AD031]
MAAETSIEEVEVSFTSNTEFSFKQLKSSVEIILSDKLPDEIAANANVFVVSNIYGYFVAGQNEGFLFDKLSSLRSAFENGDADAPNKYNEAARVEISGETVCFIRLSADELTIIVGLQGGLIQLYSISKLLAKTKGAKPTASLDLGSEIRDIRPNPAADRNGLMAVLLESKVIKMINMEGTVTATLDKHKYTAMAWSSKGKQIMCGTETGHLYQIDPEGVIKKEHLPNPANTVVTISWLETAVFIAVYNEQPEEDGTPSFQSDFCVISKEDKTKAKFSSYGDVCFPIPNDICGTNYYITPSLKTLSKNFKEFMVAGSSSSTDLAIVARGQDGEWLLLDLNEVDRPIVHGMDPCLMGMAIDLTSTTPLEPLEEEGPNVPPAPILYVYNNFGLLSAYSILELPVAKQGLPCASMVQTKPLPQAASTTKSAPKVASASLSATKATASPATPSAAPKAAPAFSFGAAAASMTKSAPSPSGGFKATAAPVSATPAITTAPKVSFGTPTVGIGATSASPSTASKAFAPSPVVNPNPAFQQGTSTPAKPPGNMQKLLQENEQPLRLVRKKSVADAPAAPAPKVSAAMDALSRQLENTYLAMTEELKTLHSHVRETEELVKAREHVFGELEQFMQVTSKRIKTAKDTKVLAETVLGDFASLRTDLVKVTTKREEIKRLLEARQDPSLLDMVLSSELNPAQVAMRDQMRRAVETIDDRLRNLEEHVESMNTKANRLRNGHHSEPPTLDSIRRSIRSISTALIARQSELDQVSSALDNLNIIESVSPKAEDLTPRPSIRDPVSAKQSKGALHSKSFSSEPEYRSNEQSKDALARQLRRVFASKSRPGPILSAPASSASTAPLSVLPKLKEVEFVPVFEPRRSERKKRLAAEASPQPEASSTTATTPSPAPPSALLQPSSQPTPAFGSTQSAIPTTTMVSTPSPAFGSAAASASLPAPTFGSPQTSPLGSAQSTPTPAKVTPFGAIPLPSFSATSAVAAPVSIGSSKTPAFAGFQVPKSESRAAPAFSAAPVFSAAPSLSATPLFSATPASSAIPASQSIAKSSAPPQIGFVGFQVPPTVGTAAKVTPTPAPAFSFNKPVQVKELEPEPKTQEDDVEGEEDQEPKEDSEEEGEEEYDEEEEGQYANARYEHDGQVYEVDEGSEPETWGSDTDQRDYDQGEEGEYADDEEGQDEQSEKEDEVAPTRVSSDKQDPFAKTAWTAPSFSFPATAPAVSTTLAATSVPASSKPEFSFLAALNKNKKSEAKVTPVAQLPFGATSGTNTFGSTTTFAFGAPQAAAASSPAPGLSFGQKQQPVSSPEITKSTVAIKASAPRAPVKTDESDDEQEVQTEEQQSDADEEEDEEDTRKNGQFEEDSDQEEDEEDDQEDGHDDIQEVPGSEDEEEGEFDEDGSEVDEDAEEVEQQEDSDKESALTAVQMRGSFALSTASDAKRDSKSSDLETSSLDFSKAGFSGSSQKTVSSSVSDKPSFGAGPAFGFGSDAQTSAKGLDMPFVKLPRNRRESRDSLDSNTTDDEDQAVPSDDDASSPVLGFGKASTKGTSGGLDSFSLSLGGDQAKTDKKPTSGPWGASSFSSWGTASQASVPSTGGFGTTSILGSSQPASSASPFAAMPTSSPAASTVTSTPTSSATTAAPAWGSGGGFGQPSQVGSGAGGFGQISTSGSGFGGNVTVFGQASQATTTTGSGFGQTSQPGSGFGQTSTLGSGGAVFGQASQFGSGASFGQTSAVGSGSGFGQTSTLGSGGSAFGQTSQVGSGSGFGQTSTLGSGFGQTSQMGSNAAFGQKSQMGGGFGQVAFGQPSQIAGGTFGKPAGAANASASTQSNFGAFASSGTNAFAALAQSSTNVLDQQSGGSAFGAGGGFGDSGSAFGSGGGFGGSNSGFGGASSGFGGASSGFGGAGGNAGGFGSFGGGNTAGGFGSAAGGQNAFASAAGQGNNAFGQAQQGQANSAFGSGQPNINTNKPSFSGFR